MDIENKEKPLDFDLFIKSVEMIYGKDYYIRYLKDKIEIHLYFQNIIIKNSHNKTHNIKDLFIVITFVKRYNKFELERELRGYRTFITTNEARIEYLHSHLSSCGEFCLGEGPLSRFMRDNAYSLYIDKKDIDLFDSMLLMIFHYAKWESIEGTPYKYLERIVNKSISGYDRINSSDIMHMNNLPINLSNTKMIRSNLSDIISNAKILKLGENNYVLKYNNEFILDLLAQDGMSSLISKKLILYKGSDGLLYKKTDSDTNGIYNLDDIMEDFDCYPTFPIELENGKFITGFSSDNEGVNKEIIYTPFVNKGFLGNLIKYVESCISNKM